MMASRKKRALDIEGRLREIIAEAESLKDEIQEGYDNMPEGIQAGANGEKSLAKIEALEEAIGELESAADQIVDAFE